MHELVYQFLKLDARLSVTVDSYEERSDIAARAIFIEGNEQGFRSLAAIIALYLNEIEDILPISDLPFVSFVGERSFRLQILYGDQIGHVSDGCVVESPDSLDWSLSETEAAVVATSLHGIGYAFKHLHFDPTPGESKFAVYCGLSGADNARAM